PRRVQHDPCPEPPAFAIEGLLQPFNVPARRSRQPEIADLERNDFEAGNGRAHCIDAGKVHQSQVASIFFVAADTLIVVQEIAAAIKDEPVTINLDALWMMRRVTVYDGHASVVDERMRKSLLGIRNLVAPI